MPTAPRPSKKMQKLLEKIIGIPPAFVKVPLTQEEKRINRELNYKQGRLSR